MGIRSRWGVLVAAVIALVLPGVLDGARAAGPGGTGAVGAVTGPVANPFPGCAAPPAAAQAGQMVVGTVACQELTTHDLGNGIPAPFEYYVPPACGLSGGARCPVLYLLHGFGGSYGEMLGTPGTSSSAWVQALDHVPPAGFESAPWQYYDPKTWLSAPAIDFILVAPLGQTLPGGYGPAARMDSYWVNWNPRYALGGDEQRYATPPPRFEDFLTDELPAFVESFLPAEHGRAGRAIAGVSLGGYGAFKEGLQHPDIWSSMISVSGAENFLFGPAPPPLPPAISPPVPITYTRVPAPTGPVTALPAPQQLGTFLTALDAFGDPVADQAYFRGNMPTDLAVNGREGIAIDSFVNDMVARRSQDAGDTPFEVIVFPMNMDMQLDFAANGVANTFAIHQGVHSDVYRNAWFRGLVEFAWAHAQHPDPAPAGAGGGTGEGFEYRTISTGFSIWGWTFSGKRSPVEFLDLSGVSCDRLTMQGSGTWTVTPPASCGIHHSVSVDLGPSGPVDQPDPVLGRTVTVPLR